MIMPPSCEIIENEIEFEEEILPPEPAGQNEKNIKEPPTAKKAKVVVQNFKQSWLKGNEEWLVQKNNSSFCKACNKLFKGNITHVNRHKETTIHIKNMNAARRSLEKQIDIKTAFASKQSPLDFRVQEAEMKLAAFAVEYNFSFNAMEHLPQLLKSAFPDSKIAQGLKCGRKKKLVQMIGEDALEKLKLKLQNTNFSIIIDEATDVCSSKSTAVLARYFNEESFKTEDSFLGLIEVSQADAETLVAKLLEHLKTLGLSLDNLIGFVVDNDSVMMTIRGEVQALLKKKCPNLVCS